jgi:predicted RND superfamily exporter protein
MGGSPEELELFIDFDNRKALITIQYKAKKISDINIISDKIDTFTLNETNITKGGYSLVEKEMNKCVATGQYYSLIVAFVAIFFILTIIFKSFSAGIMGSIPLIYAVLSTFGLMGLLGIELNIVTALISSISIGLGVDFTIHLFWRIKQELRTNIEYKEAIISAITKTGRGITINALSVITGLSILFFSSFPLIRTFAFLIILSLTLCLICSIMLIPALCLLSNPSFLRDK